MSQKHCPTCDRYYDDGEETWVGEFCYHCTYLKKLNAGIEQAKQFSKQAEIALTLTTSVHTKETAAYHKNIVMWLESFKIIIDQPNTTIRGPHDLSDQSLFPYVGPN